MINRSLGIVLAVVAGLLVLGGSYYYRAYKIAQGDLITYELPPLGYAYDSLEPYIDAQTMEIHYTKHHQAYVNKLNAALSSYPNVRKIPLEKLLSNPDRIPEAIRTAVINNGGGHYNHSFFWLVMTPESTQEPVGTIKELITQQFGSFKEFKEQFNKAAGTVFGSGWAWLATDTQGTLSIVATSNQDSPLTLGLIPLLGLDVWEHAYYLKYQNKRAEYSDSWWNVVNWEQVEENYQQALAAEKKTEEKTS